MLILRRFIDQSGSNLWLALALLLGLFLRLHGIDFGLPALNDPDELMFELGATRMLTGPTLNPGWFGHPATTTMTLLALVNATTFGVGWLAGAWTGPDGFMTAIYADPSIVILPGRMMITMFGLLTIWQVWRMGLAVSGTIAATFAALFIAASPLHTLWSQVIRSDVMGIFFMLACMNAALRIARTGYSSDFRWAALWLALAVATKWPFAVTALAVLGAGVYRMTQSEADRGTVIRQLIGFFLAVPLLLVLISPFLLLDIDTVLRNVGGEARTQHLGATGGGFFDNFRWYINGALMQGLGLGGLIFAILGLAILVRRREYLAVILPVLLSLILIICLSSLRWERWALPLLPLLALTIGIAIASLVKVAKTLLGLKASYFTTALMMAMPIMLAANSWRTLAVRSVDTRQAATHWADLHIPPGSTILVEHFAFDMIDRPFKVLFPLGDAGCVNARDMLSGRIDYRTVERAGGGRSNIDYGTVNPLKRQTCRADFAILMEMQRYHAERDRFPVQNAAYAALAAEMPVRAVIRPKPNESSGPVIIILSARGR